MRRRGLARVVTDTWDRLTEPFRDDRRAAERTVENLEDAAADLHEETRRFIRDCSPRGARGTITVARSGG